jgi:hypothetical protein
VRGLSRSGKPLSCDICAVKRFRLGRGKVLEVAVWPRDGCRKVQSGSPHQKDSMGHRSEQKRGEKQISATIGMSIDSFIQSFSRKSTVWYSTLEGHNGG